MFINLLNEVGGSRLEATQATYKGKLFFYSIAQALRMRIICTARRVHAQKPELIIDAATLTGAAKTALGNDYHALFSFDDALAGRLLASASQENEPFWRLPLAEFHRSQLPSNFAELNNTGSAAYPAGASTAAGFLSHFVENYQQGWLHIDCSATYRKAPVEQWSAGATGLGVRTIANLLTA